MEIEVKQRPKIDHSLILPTTHSVPCASCGETKPRMKPEDRPVVSAHD